MILITATLAYGLRLSAGWIFIPCRKRAKPLGVLADIRAIGAKAGLALGGNAAIALSLSGIAAGCADDHDQRTRQAAGSNLSPRCVKSDESERRHFLLRNAGRLAVLHFAHGCLPPQAQLGDWPGVVPRRRRTMM